MVHLSLNEQTTEAAKWYALRTRPKHEKSVSALLEGKGYEQILPLYQSWHRSSGRMQRVHLPLFKGYLFCRFDPLRRLPILITPGVLSIIGRGREPEALSSEEIEYIQASCASGLTIAPWPYLKSGDLVRVECGPLEGVEGIFISEKNTCRLVLSVEMLRRSVAVEVDRDWVRPIAARGRMTIEFRSPIPSTRTASALPHPYVA